MGLNTSQQHPASRKFVALFVLDPAADRLVPARCHLARPYLFKRVLSGQCGLLPNSGTPPNVFAQLVMEYLGIIPSIEQRRCIRNDMLRSQLIPNHFLGASEGMVCSTGNGCLTMIGWIDSLLTKGGLRMHASGDDFAKPEARINALNFPPKGVGRGLSEMLSIPSTDLENVDSFIDTLNDRNQKLDAGMEKMM